MKKSRLFGVLLSLALALALLSGLSAAAYAGEPPHTHNNITFVPWTDELAAQQNGEGKTAANSLPAEAGSYYLTKNVEVSAKYSDEAAWTIYNNKNISLCLNGYSITRTNDGPVIMLDFDLYAIDEPVIDYDHLENYYPTLNLFDEDGDHGTITHGKNSDGKKYDGVGVDVWNGTFNMYGGSISGNTTEGDVGGVYVPHGDTFNMYGGKITGNSGMAGGVYIGGAYSDDSGSTFNMTGGEISGNTASSSGGGVRIGYDGVFNMTGGEISDNTAAEYGGGVYSAGGGSKGSAFNMSSGEISGNTAGEAGGGVYFGDYYYYGDSYSDIYTFTLTGGEISGNVVTNTSTNNYDTFPDAGGGVFLSQGTFNLSGAPTISGNRLGEGKDAVDNNVYLYTEDDTEYYTEYYTKITLTGALTNTTLIGVTSYDTNVDFTSGWNDMMSGETPTAYFRSDDPGYTVVKVGDELQLAKLTNFKFTINPTTNGSVTATVLQDGNAVSVDPDARIQNGTEVTLAVSPASGYVLKDIYYVEGSGTEKKRPTATADPNVFTIEMPQADVTVTASFSTPVTYLDSNGDSQTCANYENVRNSLAAEEWGTEGSDSWYVVSDKTSVGTVTLKGNVHLILEDGANLTVNGRISGVVNGVSTGTFTIYAQSNGGNMGSLTANDCIEAKSVTINGGNVTASSEESDGIWASNDLVGGIGVTINGGVVTASTTSYGGCAINAWYPPSINENLVVKAGNDEASAAVVTDYTTEINYKKYKWVQIAPSQTHTHNFTSYTASGATITAICTAPGCTLEAQDDGQYAVTLTIVAPTLTTYGEAGKSEFATLKGLEEFNAATGLDVNVTYYEARKSDNAYTKGKELSEAPTGAGVYLAEITLNGVGDAPSVSASVVYTIAPAVIDAVTVTGIDAPEAATALDTAATLNTEHVTLRNSNAITWVPAAPQDGLAAYATAYKAAVTADADTNYAFSDAVAATVNGQTADVTKNQDGSVEISLTFSKTALTPVTISAANQEVDYSRNGVSIPVQGMFTVPEGAGAATYSVTNGTGAGSYDKQSGKLSVTKCGTFTVSVNTAATDTHTAGVASATLTVNKAEATVTPPTARTLIFNGSNQDLVVSGSTEDGTVLYAVTTEDTQSAPESFFETIPSATDMGTYYVWYKVQGDDNHNDTTAEKLKVTINAPVFGTPDFTLPASIQTIGANAFEGAAMTIVDARSCTAIGAEAFKGCTALKQIRITENCTIDGSAFDDCGMVFIFAPTGSKAESYCRTSTNCVFIAYDHN